MATFYKKSQKGFTLVELLVVIAIIGTLATLLLLQLGVARAKARDTKRIADINQLRSAVELYFDDNNGHYPDSLTCGVGGTISKYLSAPACPIDPITQAGYFYARNPAGAGTSIQFHLWAELEGKSTALNGDTDLDSTGWAGNATDASGVATEACSANYAAGAARDCIYDTGQK